LAADSKIGALLETARFSDFFHVRTQHSYFSFLLYLSTHALPPTGGAAKTRIQSSVPPKSFP